VRCSPAKNNVGRAPRPRATHLVAPLSEHAQWDGGLDLLFDESGTEAKEEPSFCPVPPIKL
jgi:hypothetical protein